MCITIAEVDDIVSAFLGSAVGRLDLAKVDGALNLELRRGRTPGFAN